MTSSASISTESDAEIPASPRLGSGVSWEDGAPTKLRCPACHKESPCPKILTVPIPQTAHAPMALHFCPECHSHFYDPLPDINYSARYSKAASLYALAQGTSLEFALAAVSPLVGKKGRFLDVGCGPGLMVDFWERLHFGSATGIEPSSSGSFARDDLHRNIRVLHLAEDEGLHDEVYDVVMSTEVVEHVADPALFLRDLSRKVAADGVLIFSTPNLGPIAADRPVPSNLVETLSPGFHVTLFSEAALRSLLAGLNWPHVELVDHRGHWIVYASRKPITVNIDLAWAEEMHRKYLELAVEDGGLSPSARALFGFRLFRKAANEGNWKQVDVLLPKLGSLLPVTIARWTLHPDEVIEAGGIPDDVLREWVSEFYHLPAFLFLLGVRCKNHLGKTAVAVHFFQLACRLSRLLVLHYLDDAYTKEIYWVSRLNAGLALLESGQEREGTEILEKIGTSHQSDDPVLRRMLPQLKFATRARLENFRHQVMQGDWKSAGLLHAPLQGFLAASYQASLLRVTGWLDLKGPWPEEWSPLWYFYSEQMLRLNTGRFAEAAEGFDLLSSLCQKMLPHPEAEHLLPLCRRHAELACQRMAEAGKIP